MTSIPHTVPPRRPCDELTTARSSASFSTDRLSEVLYGGPSAVKLHNAMSTALATDSVMQTKTDAVFLDRRSQYLRSLDVMKRLREIGDRLGLTPDQRVALGQLAGESTPGTVSSFMFVPLIETEGGPGVKADVLEDAKTGRLVGCYAQTELAHGSNVRGLETTATYVGRSTDGREAVLELNTPNVGATKWWSGALGATATHAIVFARVITKDGTDRGVCPMLVQIRDRDTLEPMPGVTVGDIGPKLGFNEVDNGFASFDGVKVLGSRVLGSGGVDASGGWVAPKHSRSAYLGMVAARCFIVVGAASSLARGLAIAVRYSHVRRQFGDDGTGKEVPVMTHRTQYGRLIPLLATCFAFWSMGRDMAAAFRSLKADATRGEYAGLASMHAMSCGLKVYCTTVASAGLDTCRLCCGGHGYSKFSGLPQLFTYFTHLMTADGENFVIAQQTARYLLKAAAGSSKHAVGHAAYLAKSSTDAPVLTPTSVQDPSAVVLVCQAAVRAALTRIRDGLTAAMTGGASQADAWNSVMDLAKDAVNLHSSLVVVQSFFKTVSTLKSGGADAGVVAVLSKLAALFGVSCVEAALPWVGDGPASWDAVRTAREALMTAILPDSVALVDSWLFSDTTLGSALGRYDGAVYDALLGWAKLEPLTVSPPKAAIRSRL